MNKSEKFWDKTANEYDKRDIEFVQTTVESTIKHLNVNDVVLDYACGTGIMAHEIAENVKLIHAIDTSSKMIDLAIRKGGERNIKNIHYAQTTIFDERYEPEYFNVILAFNILHLLEEPQKVLQRISELIKPGGLFLSATPCLGEKLSFLSFFLSLLSKIGIVPDVKSLKISDLEGLIANGDFQIIETVNLHQSLPDYFIVAKKI